ncbi:MAG TPA: serine hydrolase [Acidobacteriota bacterium]|nr:serine hydrolase [Acidobacteriota bacterium]
MNGTYSRAAVVLTVILALVFASDSAGRSASAEVGKDYSEAISKIEKYIEGFMEAYKVPGLSITIYKDDFLWTKGIGYADLENMVPATAETRYSLASVTKPMTAVAIVKLAEEGKLNLDDEIQKYVPFFPKKKYPVTVRQLLGHLGGISHYTVNEKGNLGSELVGHLATHHTTEEAIAIFKDLELVAEPGTEFHYSSYGYNLLGAAIDGASGMPYARYMTEEVWLPMGMIDTRINNHDDIIPHRARGYDVIDGANKNAEFRDVSTCFASGAAHSTARDMVLFAKGLDEGKVLPLESQQQMYDSMITSSGEVTDTGMGWATFCYGGYWYVHHPGGHEGFSAVLLRFPWENFAVGIACNLQEVQAREIADYVTAQFFNAYRFRCETGGVEGNVVAEGLLYLWNMGLGYHNRFGGPMATDIETVKQSFARIKEALSDEAVARLVSGGKLSVFQGISNINEFSDDLYKVGSYIAEKLREANGRERLAYYSSGNAMPFFEDYIVLYSHDDSIPAKCRFSNALERRISDWTTSWRRIWYDEMKDLILMPIQEFGERINGLVEICEGESIYPALGYRLNSYAYRLKRQGEIDEGLAILMAASRLYPSDANLLDSLGEFHLQKGDRENAIHYYKLALEKNPNLISAKEALAELEKA